MITAVTLIVVMVSLYWMFLCWV